MTSLRLTLCLVAALAVCGAGFAQEDRPADQDFRHPLAGVSLDSLEATRAQPLFAPSRRPVASEPEFPQAETVMTAPEPVPARPAELPRLRLLGVLMSRAQHIAVMRNEETGEVHRLAPGDRIGGWTVTILDPQRVAFENAGTRHIQSLFQERRNPVQEDAGDPPPAAPTTIWR